MKFLCWLFGHKPIRITRSRGGDLEKLLCLRCKWFLAMHHPTKYLGLWDNEDVQMLRILDGISDSGEAREP